MSDTIRLWGDTESLVVWDDANCNQCVKEGPTCDLWLAITVHAYADEDLTPEVVVRLGYPEDDEIELTWPCKERRRVDDPPIPAAYEMAQAGAPMLPGFALTSPPATADEGAET